MERSRGTENMTETGGRRRGCAIYRRVPPRRYRGGAGEHRTGKGDGEVREGREGKGKGEKRVDGDGANGDASLMTVGSEGERDGAGLFARREGFREILADEEGGYGSPWLSCNGGGHRTVAMASEGDFVFVLAAGEGVVMTKMTTVRWPSIPGSGSVSGEEDGGDNGLLAAVMRGGRCSWWWFRSEATVTRGRRLRVI